MGEVIHFKMYSRFAQRKKMLFMPLSSIFVTILDATGKNQNTFIGIDVCTNSELHQLLTFVLLKYC